jgi:hypothetical protein
VPQLCTEFLAPSLHPETDKNKSQLAEFLSTIQKMSKELLTEYPSSARKKLYKG